LRIYIAVTVPWIAFFGYRFLDALQYPHQRYAFRAFWYLLLVPVGGPISLLVILWVQAGFRKSEQTASEAKTATGAGPSQPRPHPKPSTSTAKAKSVPDNIGVGRALGRIFFEPEIWHEMSELCERDELAARELAFARVAILRRAIKRLQPHGIAVQMSTGVDQFVAGAFATPEEATTAMIAIQLYEQNALSLTELAKVIVRRVAHSDGIAVDVAAALLEMPTAEAERLMKISSLMDKLPH
jgi:hypothetical protein